jgi:hypothetical protein
MGLCNTERYSGILRTAKKIYENALEIPEAYDIKAIREHALKIWPMVFGATSNSGHWIMGSSATNEVIREDSPWAVVIMDHWSEVRDKDNFFNQIRENAPFDPFDWCLTISGFIEGENKGKARVYDVYAWTEQLIYYLRRYNDEFMRGYQELSDWASTTLGLCYAHFYGDDVYARAYTYNQLCEKIYKNQIVEKIAAKQCWHHDFRARFRDYSLEDLMDFHMRLFKKEPALKTLLDVSLELMGRSYHYTHKYQELVKYLKEEHKYTNTGSFKKVFESNLKKYQDHDKRQKDNYRTDRDKEAFEAVHGYDWV